MYKRQVTGPALAVAATVKEPGMPFAVSVRSVVAMPLESVTVSVVPPPLKVALAPPVPALIVKVTGTNGRRFPLISFTVACNAANAEFTTTLCELPPVGAMLPGAVAVPLRVTVCELLTSGESTNTSEPVRSPVVDGLKTTLTVQFPPAGIIAPPQLSSDKLKSLAGEAVAEATETGEVVPLFKVTVTSALNIPTNCRPVKVTGFGLTLTTGAKPLPESVTGSVPPLVWIVAVSLFAPAAGVNLMYTVQEPVYAASTVDDVQALAVSDVSTL